MKKKKSQDQFLRSLWSQNQMISFPAVTGNHFENFTKWLFLSCTKRKKKERKKRKARVFSCPWLQQNFSKYFTAAQNTAQTSSSHQKLHWETEKCTGKTMRVFSSTEASQKTRSCKCCCCIWKTEDWIAGCADFMEPCHLLPPGATKFAVPGGDTPQREVTRWLWR